MGLQGTVGGLVFRKDGSVSQKPASNKAAFSSAPGLARTRENASEFGRAATKRQTHPRLAAGVDCRRQRQPYGVAPDSGRARRDWHGRGQRPGPARGGQSQHERPARLQLQPGRRHRPEHLLPLHRGGGGDVTLSIPALNPQIDIATPQGATHYELLFGASALNFEAGSYKQAVVAAPLGVVPVNGAASANVTVTASFAEAPTAEEVVIGAVGINYYQQLNGKLYPLNNNGTNPLAIEYVG